MPATWASAAVGVIGAISASDSGGGGGGGGDMAQMQQMQLQQKQMQMAEDQWKRYMDVYAPLEDAYASQAQNEGSIANQNQAAGKVAAANSAAYASARERLSKNPGINPSDQQYLQAENKINLAEAASSATGQNDAREKVINRGQARMTDALSIGKGMPANAAAGINSAASTGSGLMSAGYAQQNRQQDMDMAGIGQMGKAIGGLTQSKTFQNWLNSPSTSSTSGSGVNVGQISYTPDAAANFYAEG